jgi:hypothetical protein
MLNWSKVPQPVDRAFQLVHHTNETRGMGIAMDNAQVLAAKVACLVLREYFSRVLTALEDGELDPMTVDEWKELASATSIERPDDPE